MHSQAQNLREIVAHNNAWKVLARQHPSRIADLVNVLSDETGQQREDLIASLVSLYGRYANEWGLGSVRAMFDRELEDLKKLPKRMKQSQSVSHEGISK